MYHQKPLLGQQIDWAHPLSKGLVGCWVMNEGSGNKIVDLSGNGRDGILTDASSEFSWHSNGLSFVGDHISYFALSPKIILGTSDPWTMVIVLQCDDAVESMAIGDLGASSYLWFYSGNYLRFRNASGSNLDITEFGSFLSRTQVALVADGAGNIDSYQDAKFVATDIHGTNFNFGTIGSGYNNDSYTLDGVIYQLYIYNRILTPQQITQLYIDSFCMFRSYFDPALMAYVAVAGGLSIPIAMYYQMHHNQ